MPDIWFTADFHFGHSNIIRYCNRPFRNAEEMDQTILERLNASVKVNDILYFLGDFCIGSKTRDLEHRKQIRCKKVFAAPGKHDKEARKLAEEFTWLGQPRGNLCQRATHRAMSLRHARLEPCPSRRVASLRFHGKLPEAPTSLSMDVGVDTHDFRPWHFGEFSLLVTEKAKARGELQSAAPSNSQ
jgi:calcineurin-like phosphoesterase family protein